MMLTREHLASQSVLEMIHILEKRVDDKITENRKLRQQLDAQKQQYLLQTGRMIDMKTKIKSLEEPEAIDVGAVINLQTERMIDMRARDHSFEESETFDAGAVLHLEWDEVEMPNYHNYGIV